MKRNFGQLDSLSSPKESLFHIKENGWENEFEKMFMNALVGNKKNVREKINDLNKKVKSDEINPKQSKWKKQIEYIKWI